jgi:predicted ATPase
VCSHATAELVHDTGDAALTLRDLGEHRLRGLSRPERVYQVVMPDLADEFPRLRSETRPDSDLPAQLTSFVGREDDLDNVARLLNEGRLITVTGVGGVGKTRLAIEVARRLEPGFRDGARLCELAPATDDTSMLEIVSVRLGVVDRPGMSRRESTLDALANSELLLLLDNCEHLLAPLGEFVGELLALAPKVTVLATSREPLNMHGEHVWALRSLSVPKPGEDGATESTESVDLFVDRARAVRPTFGVDDQARRAIGDICRRLDGMPLAIELAAARVLAMQPAEIAARLDERFRLLSGGRRTTVERHQTLRATVDWSYSLLTDAERTTFARLSVFPGSFDTPAALAVVVGEGLEDWDVIDALESLVSKSMVFSEDGGDGSSRFSMLETLRQYGREKLADAGGDEIARRQRRHASHYADLAVELGPLLTGREEVVASRRIVQEIENFRSAIAWGLDNGGDDASDAVRIAAWLVPIVTRHRALGFGSDVERCSEAALGATPGLRFAVLGGAAMSAVSRGDLERTRSWLAAAFSEPPVAEVVGCLSPAYTALALLEIATDMEVALDSLRRGTEAAEASNQPFDAVVLLALQATFSALVGREKAGHQLSEAAVVAARALGNPTALAIATYIWATAHWMDDPAAARAALEESVALTESGASDVIYGDTQELLARLEFLAGDVSRALRTIEGALNYSTSVGNRPSVVGHLWYAGEIAGNFGIEAEFTAVTHGICTRNAEMPAMFLLEGRERDIHESALDHARTALGPDRFEALCEQGGRMSFTEVVDYSRRELDRIIAEVDTLGT